MNLITWVIQKNMFLKNREKKIEKNENEGTKREKFHLKKSYIP